MTNNEKMAAACLEGIDRFCEANGFPTPPLREETRGTIVCFIGAAPDGREFALGYEPSERP